ncbi:MAG: DMT family transporter [Inquilinus sp.]|nr:DMT family transporter [Inquilinus sp.]
MSRSTSNNQAPHVLPSGGDLLAYALLMAAPALMASNVVIGRAATAVMPPVGLAFWRWVLALALLLPLAGPGLWRHRATLRREWRAIAVLGALGMGVCGSFVYIGLRTTTATNAGLIYAASPALILLIGAVFRSETVRPRQVAGIALAILGVAAILTRGRPAALLAFDFTLGDLWVLGATIAWAAYSVLLKRHSVSLPTFVLFAAIAAAGVLCLAPFYAWETLAGDPVVWTGEALLSVAGVAVFASVLAYSSYQKGVALVGPSRAGPFMYLMPVYAALLAVLLLGEILRPFHAAGFALILSGVALASARLRPVPGGGD